MMTISSPTTFDEYQEINNDRAEVLFTQFMDWHEGYIDKCEGGERESMMATPRAEEFLGADFLKELHDQIPYMEEYLILVMDEEERITSGERENMIAALFQVSRFDIRPNVVIRDDIEGLSRLVQIRSRTWEHMFGLLEVSGQVENTDIENIDLYMKLVMLHEIGHAIEVEMRMFDQEVIDEFDIDGIGFISYEEVNRYIVNERDNMLRKRLSEDEIILFFFDKSREQKSKVFQDIHQRDPESDEELDRFYYRRFPEIEMIYKNLPSEQFADKFMVFAAERIPSIKAKLDVLRLGNDNRSVRSIK